MTFLILKKQKTEKRIQKRNGRNFPRAAVRGVPYGVCRSFSLFSPKMESSYFLTRFFFSKKKKINIILFLFRPVGSLLFPHCCRCDVPTVHLQPFNFHRPAFARPTRLKIASIFPLDEASYTQQQVLPQFANFCVQINNKMKAINKKIEAAEVCCTPETDYYHVYRWRFRSRSLNNLLVKKRKKNASQ